MDYDHLYPEYAHATEHREAGITLLCPNHHRARHSNRISYETIQHWNANPYCAQHGVSWDELDLSSNSVPSFDLGVLAFVETPVVLRIHGRDIVRFLPPEEAGAPFRLNAVFANSTGHEIGRIRENLWEGSADAWDIETKGARTTIRNDSSDIALVWRIKPPDRVVIERARMMFDGVALDMLEWKRMLARTVARQELDVEAALVVDAAVGLEVDKDDIFALGVNAQIISIQGLEVRNQPGAHQITFADL